MFFVEFISPSIRLYHFVRHNDIFPKVMCDNALSSGRPDDAPERRGGERGGPALDPAEGAREQVLRAAHPAASRQGRGRARLLGLLHTRLAVPQPDH